MEVDQDRTQQQDPKIERLEVEDEAARQRRLQSVMEKLNSTSTARPTTSTFPSFDFGDRTTYAVDPPTELLSRVQAFLPQLEASNSILAQRAQADPQSVDIEHVEDDMEQYIEMNLGLGVFEDRSSLKGQGPKQDYEMGHTSSSDSTSSSSDESEEDSDADSDDSSEPEIITSFLPSRPVKPLPKRNSSTPKRPEIVVLSGEES